MRNAPLFIIMVLTFLCGGKSQAVVINIDFDARSVGSAGDGDNRTGTLFSGQGVYFDPGNNYWNGVTIENPTGTGLLASDGTTVTAIDVYVIGGGGFVDLTKTNYLLSDYFYGATTTVITGLNPSGSYTVYVYAAGDQSGQGSTITINGVSQSTTNTGNPDVYSLGVNYVVFETTADIIGRIVIDSSDKINGIQLVEGEPAPTSYEAEDAAYSGVNVIAEVNASGGECLDGFDAIGDYVDYQNVEAGNILKVRFSNALSATRCSVYVNGVDVETAYFGSTGSWSNFVTMIMTDIDIPASAAHWNITTENVTTSCLIPNANLIHLSAYSACCPISLSCLGILSSRAGLARQQERAVKNGN